MPDFNNQFADGKKMTADDLIRGVRFMVAAEYEAVQMYTQLAEATDNDLAKTVLNKIADEELVHAGEFIRLLKELAPDEESKYNNGAKEVDDEISKRRGRYQGIADKE